jgi:DNA repair ATPase RecN
LDAVQDGGRDRAEGEEREGIMAKKVVNRRWSYAEDRRFIQIAVSSRSLKAIAHEMNRTPERVVQMAMRLGIPLKSAAKLSPSRTARRPWTADEHKKLDDLLRAGKDAGEIATALRRTRQAIYARLQSLDIKRRKAARSLVEIGLQVKK